jgi:hypothetical protein
LETTVTNISTTFELPEPKDDGLYYYLSFKNESQGIINQQFPASGSVTYQSNMNCQDYYLFVFDDGQNVHQSIINFYSGIDTTMIYFCKGVVGCI